MTEHEDLLDTSRRIVTREAKRSRRLSVVVIALLASFGGYMTSLHASDDGSMGKLQTSFSTLQTKSTEQTIAEVQLRDDVNRLSNLNKSLSADHGESVQLFCSILRAVHDHSAVYMQYCPVKVP